MIADCWRRNISLLLAAQPAWAAARRPLSLRRPSYHRIGQPGPHLLPPDPSPRSFPCPRHRTAASAATCAGWRRCVWAACACAPAAAASAAPPAPTSCWTRSTGEESRLQSRRWAAQQAGPPAALPALAQAAGSARGPMAEAPSPFACTHLCPPAALLPVPSCSGGCGISCMPGQMCMSGVCT